MIEPSMPSGLISINGGGDEGGSGRGSGRRLAPGPSLGVVPGTMTGYNFVNGKFLSDVI